MNDNRQKNIINRNTKNKFGAALKANLLVRNHDWVNNWTARTSATNNAWFSVCWSSELGIFCAVSWNGTGNRVMTSPDGITWTVRTSAVDNAWHSVCWSSELGIFCSVADSGTGNRVMTNLGDTRIAQLKLGYQQAFGEVS